MAKTGKFDKNQLGLNLDEERGIASFLGLAIADALGAST